MIENSITLPVYRLNDAQKLSLYMREILVIIVNVAIAALMAFVFPSDNFSNSSIYITLSLMTAIAFTYAYLFAMKLSSTRILVIFHLQTFLNVLIAAVLVDILFFDLAILLIYYILTQRLISKAPTVLKNIESSLYLIYQVALLGIWMLKDVDTDLYLLNFLLSQLLVGIVYIKSVNEHTPIYIKFSPLVFNLLSIPIIGKFDGVEGVSLLENLNLIENKFDYNMLILVLFTLSYILKYLNSSIDFSSGNVFFGVILVLQYFFYESRVDFIGLKTLNLGDVHLNLFNLVFIGYLILVVVDVRRFLYHNISAILSISAVVAFYTLITPQGVISEVNLDSTLLSIGILCVGLITMMSEKSMVFGLPIQSMLILLQITHTDPFSGWISSTLHIAYFVQYLWFAFNRLEDQDLDYFLAIPIFLLILELIFEPDINDTVVWMKLILSMVYLFIIFRPVETYRNSGVTYAVSLFLLLVSFHPNFTSDLVNNVSAFSLGILLYSVMLGVQSYRDSGNINNHNNVASQLLLISVVLLHSLGDVNGFGILILLLAIPFVGLKSRYDSINGAIQISIHFLSFVTFTLLNLDDNLIINAQALNSILLIVFVVFYVLRLQKDEEIFKYFTVILVSVFGLFSMISMIMQDTQNTREIGIPYQSVLLILALVPLWLKQERSEFKQFIHMMVSISFAILYFTEHQELMEYSDILSFSIIIAQQSIIVDSYFVILVLFIGLSSYLLRKTDSEKLQAYYGIHIFGLLIFLTVLNNNQFVNIPIPIFHLILIQIIIYLVFAFASRKLDLYLLASFVSLYIIFLSEGESPEIYLSISDNFFSLTIISFVVTPLVFTILSMKDKMETIDLRYISGVFGVMIFFAITSFVRDLSIPQELYFLNLILLIIPVIDSARDGKSFWYFMFVGFYEVIFLVLENEPSIITTIVYSEFYLITILLMLVVECVMIYTLIKTENDASWHVAFLNFIFRLYMIYLILDLLDPLTAFLIVLLYGLPLILQSNIIARTYTPLYQALCIILISLGSNLDISDFGDLNLMHLIYIIWATYLIVAWYRRGIEIQIQTNIIAIFGASVGLILINNQFTTLSTILIAIIPITIVLIIGLIYYNRQGTTTNEMVVFSTIFVLYSTLVHYRNAIRYLDGPDEIFIRLLIDFLIFAPMVLEIILFVKPILDRMYETSSTSGTADAYLVGLLTLFTALSLIMGSDGIFALKLLFIALGFWILSGIFVRDSLAWLVSLYTVFVMGWLLAQLGTTGDAVTSGYSEEFTLYFLGMSLIGVIMLVGAVINEKGYRKEPFTMSLSVTGSILAATTIIIPAFVDSPFPLVDTTMSTHIVNFLPNVFWALLGLALFLLARNLKKDYMSRLSFGILILDIVKTLYDILTGTENPLIRIVGSISIGIVCVFIFYVFSREDTSEILVNDN